jgi:ferredoxin
VQQASPEDVEKARKLQLPDNFYLYKQRPKCTGCRGCEDHDTDEELKKPSQIQQITPPAFAGLVFFA